MKCKKWIALLAAFGMAAAFRFSAAAQETVDGNLVRMTTSAAQLTNLTVDETIGAAPYLPAAPPLPGPLRPTTPFFTIFP